MSNTADQRLSRIRAKQAFGQSYASDDSTARMDDDAHAMAEAEKMSLAEARRIISGQSRPPYGTPRRS